MSAEIDVTLMPKIMRKVRGDAKLEALTLEQQAMVHLWLEEHNLTYTKVSELVATHFDVAVSKSAVATYWQRRCVHAEHEAAVEAAEALAKLPLAKFSGAALNRARLLAFTLLVRPEPAIDTATRLLETIRRADQQDLSRERLALEKERVSLRKQELAARPPRHARPTPPARQTLHAPALSTHHQDVSPDASPIPDLPSPNSDLRPTPTEIPAIEIEHVAAVLEKANAPARPSPKLAPPEKTPPNPPLFPASSSVAQPSAPPALNPAPAAPTSVPSRASEPSTYPSSPAPNASLPSFSSAQSPVTTATPSTSAHTPPAPNPAPAPATLPRPAPSPTPPPPAASDSVTSAPPPCSPRLNSTLPAALQPPHTPTTPPLPKNPPNPPLFPASSNLSRPLAPNPAKASAESASQKTAPIPSKPPAQASAPIATPPPPGQAATANARPTPNSPPAWLTALASRL